VFSLGGTEILLIGALALLLFGPDKIPQVARTVGRFVREFNKYKDIMESTFRSEMYAAEMQAADKKTPRDGSEPGSGSDLDRLTQAAQASRDFAAERGTEIPEASDVLAASESSPAVDEPAEAGSSEGHFPATATDEEEEEG
jgi:TatA/E family protein of Tat protein translocase